MLKGGPQGLPFFLCQGKRSRKPTRRETQRYFPLSRG